MSRNTMRWMVPVAMVGLSPAFLVGCDKEAMQAAQEESKAAEQAQKEGATEKQGALTDQDGAATKAAQAKTEPAAADPEERPILKHLPADCGRMELYVNLERFGKYQETGTQIATVAGKALARTDADEKFVAPVLKALHAEGLDLTEDLDEVAACANDKNEWVALLSVDLSDTKLEPEKLLSKAAAAAGQPGAQIQKSGDVSYVVPKATGGALGFVTSKILGFASRPELLAKAAEGNAKPMSIDEGPGHLATIRFPAGDERGDFSLSGDEESITASLFLPLNEQERKALGDELVRYLALLRGIAEARIDKATMENLKVPSLEAFIKDFERLDMSVTKEELKAKVTVSTEQLQQAVAAVAAIKPSSFERALKAGGAG